MPTKVPKQYIEDALNYLKSAKNQAWLEQENLNQIYAGFSVVKESAISQVLIDADIMPWEYCKILFNGQFENCCCDAVDFSYNDNFGIIPAKAFYKASINNLIIGPHINIIQEAAFRNCDALEYVKIPDNVTSLYDNAFSHCPDLISVDIGSGITELNNSTFTNCPNLEKVYLPSTIEHMSAGVFSHHKKLLNIYYAGTKEQWDNITKVTLWSYKINPCIIHCTDGIIEVEDNT